MFIKLFYILVSFILPPLGLITKSTKTIQCIISVLLWGLAVYCFFEVSVITGISLYIIVTSFSIVTIINHSGNISAIHYGKLSIFTLLGSVLILTSFMLSFSSRITEDRTPTVSTERLANGKQLFKQCLACHRTTKENFVGPHLVNIYGRKAGSIDGYNYSANMKKANFSWLDDELLMFLTNQNDVVPNTRMIIAPLPKEDILDIIEYLKAN